MIELIAGMTTLSDLLGRSGNGVGSARATLKVWSSLQEAAKKTAVLVREGDGPEKAPMLIVGLFEGLSAVSIMSRNNSAGFEWTVAISRVGYTMAPGDTLRIFQDTESLTGAYRHLGRSLSLQDNNALDLQELNDTIQSIAKAY